MKHCITCGQEKMLTEYHRRSKADPTLRGECKSCNRARTDKWQRANPESVKRSYGKWYETNGEARRERLREQKFGITEDDYQEMLKQQGGSCAICGGLEPKGKSRFHIDHDHKTSKVRGLLCSTCNTGLGQFQDSPELLRAAIRYLGVMP